VRTLYGRTIGARHLDWVARRNREYDRLTVKVMRKVLRKGSNSVDAGANEGLLLRHALKAAPRGTHFAFEPIPALAEALERHYPQAVVQEVALADFDGEATFRYLPASSTISSLYVRPDREEGQQVVTLNVPVRRLDGVLPVDLPIDFIKVDVEGAEGPLFRGASETLRRCHPVVVFECHPQDLSNVADILDLADYEVGLLEDFLSGTHRGRAQVEDDAVKMAHWYFTATARS
jgi:FkbM family methyltransferase